MCEGRQDERMGITYHFPNFELYEVINEEYQSFLNVML